MTSPLDGAGFRGRAVDLPDSDPRVRRRARGFEPEQISVSLSTTSDSAFTLEHHALRGNKDEQNIGGGDDMHGTSQASFLIIFYFMYENLVGYMYSILILCVLYV